MLDNSTPHSVHSMTTFSVDAGSTAKSKRAEIGVVDGHVVCPTFMGETGVYVPLRTFNLQLISAFITKIFRQLNLLKNVVINYYY